MSKILKAVVLIIFSFFIAVMAVHKWFEGGTIIYYWDSLLSFDLTHSLHFLDTWDSNIFPGDFGFGWAWIPYVLPTSLFAELFSSLSTAQFLLYISFIMLSIISYYLFLSYLASYLKINKNKYISLGIISFSIIYSLNLYTFYYAYFMFNPQIYIYSMLPFNFLCLIKLFPLDKNNQHKRSFWLFAFFLSELFLIPGFISYIYLAQYLIIIFIYLFFYFFTSNTKLISRKTLNICLFFLLVVLINSWWFSPIISILAKQYESQASLGTSIYLDVNAQGSTLLNILRILGSPMMINNAFSWNEFYVSGSVFTLPIFLLPFLIVFLMLRLKNIKNKNILIYFLFLLLMFIFIMKAGNPPLSWILRFAFDYIPFFGAFRDAYQKAGLFYFFSYFVLTGVGLMLLLDYLIRYKMKKTIFATFFLVLCVTAIITGPFFIFSYDNVKKVNFTYGNKDYVFSSKTQIPVEYYDLKLNLEKECQRTTTLVIPKTSIISNAVWEKTGYSYVGQEILNRLINCSFLNTQFIQNKPDSFNMSPYLMLQKDNLQDFKNFLVQNQIGLVLVKKDNVPFYYTNYLNLNDIDPEKIAFGLEKDEEFNKIYENTYFKLFKLNTIKDFNYGFSTPSRLVYTNLQLNSGEEFEILSRQIGAVEGYIIVSENTLLKQFSEKISDYSSVANCVGCIKINAKLPQVDDDSFIKKIKTVIKTIIGKTNPVILTDEDKISYSLIHTQNEFLNLFKKIDNGTTGEVKDQASKYILSFRDTINNLNSLNSDFFTKNNKSIEVINFLIPQQEKLINFVTGGNFNPTKINPLRDNELNTQILYLLSYIEKSINDIKNNIWETDYIEKVYRMRLDISHTGDYRCFAEARNSNLNINKVTINNNELSLPGYITLSKGSFQAEIKYNVKNILELDSLQENVGGINEIKAGLLKNGSYHIGFTLNEESEGTYVLLLSKGKLDLNEIRDGVHDKNSIVFGTILKKSNKQQAFSKEFNVNNFDHPVYYFYVINLDTNSNNPSIYNDFIISPEVGNDDVRLYCLLETSKKQTTGRILDVRKNSPMKYELKMSKNFSGFLAFNQTYNKDWIAYPIDDNKKNYYHFSSSYSNAWYIDSPTDTIIIEYIGYKKTIRNAFILVAVFILTLILYIRLNKK